MSSGDEDSAVRFQRYTSTGWAKEELCWFDGGSAIAAKRVIHAAIVIEAENRELKIRRSCRENFPVGLNGDGKCRSSIGATDQDLTAGPEPRIESAIGVVTQQTGLLRILSGWDRPGHQDLAITLESPGIR